MKIILSEAAIDENGQTGYEGTKPGDQNGNEVRQISYYKYRSGWAHVYRWKNRTIADRFAIRMIGATVNNHVGYSQPKRYTYWDQMKVSDLDPMKIKTDCEVDCSALVCANVNAALIEAGIKTNISPFEYTASMAAAFNADKNFIDVVNEVNLDTGEGLMVGDILLGPPQTHTAAVTTVEEDKKEETVYRVQVGAYKYVAYATAWQTKMKEMGYSDAFIVKGADNIYRVQIGAFTNKKYADLLFEKLKERGIQAFVTSGVIKK